LGKAAVELALRGANAVMPAIKRTSNRPYRWSIDPVPLHRVANREKKMPRRFITKDGFGITPQARAYFEPLIAGEAYPEYERGLPRYTRLKQMLVQKRCPPWEAP
jgi:6-phosphofructokinase 1